ncbi:hypothetical protein AVEN_172352-1 [Araneus ventricosus]|uniref:Uncharacterized protein n=1 Tax=Araneus ventricosus TaxID=182803 RepID=A0A4Y2E215_ARAVE|nr:hypothetical protein AVEN_172352-1 [Araneus ventricosus]
MESDGNNKKWLSKIAANLSELLIVPPEKSTPNSLYFPDVSSLMSRNPAASKEIPDAASTPLHIYNVFQKCQRKVLTIVFIICFRKNVI